MSWRYKGATIRQKAILFEWGISCPRSRGEASRLIEKIITLKAKTEGAINLPSGDFGMKPVLKGVKRFE